MNPLDLGDIRSFFDRGGEIMTGGEARQMIVDLLTRGDLEPSAMDKALIMQVSGRFHCKIRSEHGFAAAFASCLDGDACAAQIMASPSTCLNPTPYTLNLEIMASP